MSEKNGNPKDGCGVMKAPLSYVSMPVMFEVGLGMLEGGLKYGRHNYRTLGVRASIYFDATMRHLAWWWEGQDYDPDSKARLHHVTKAIASLTVLRDAMLQGMLTDDRPPKSKVDWQALNAQVRLLNEQYPEPKPVHTELEDAGEPALQIAREMPARWQWAQEVLGPTNAPEWQ